MKSDFIQPPESRFGLKAILLLLVSLVAVSAAAQPADSLLKASKAWEAQHRYRRAAETMDQLVKLEPTNAAYLDRRGRLLHVVDENDKALADLKRAQALDGPSAERYYQMALIQSRVMDLEDARASIKEGLKLDPKRADFYAILSEMEIMEGNMKEAAKNVKKALKLDPKHPWARHCKAALGYQDLGADKSRPIFEANLRDNPDFPMARFGYALLYPLNEKDYDRVVELLTGINDPRYSVKAYKILSDIYDQTKESEPDAPRHKVTLEFMERCLEEDPRMVPLRKWVIERWAMAGDTARACRQTELMLKHLNAAPAEDRRRDLYTLVFCMASDCGKDDRAAAVVDSLAAAGQIAHPIPLAYKTAIYRARKNYAAAERVLKEAFEQEPTNENLYKLRSENLVDLNRPQLGVEVSNQAIEANRDCGICYFYRGLFKLALTDSAAAMDDLDQALALDRSDLALHNYAGWLRFHVKRDTAGALAAFDVSIAKHPEFMSAYSSKAYVLMRQGKSEEALSILNQSLQIDGKNAEAFYYRALIFEALGRKEEACEEIHSAMTAMFASSLETAFSQSGTPVRAQIQSQGRNFDMGGRKVKVSSMLLLNPIVKDLYELLSGASLRLCPQNEADAPPRER